MRTDLLSLEVTRFVTIISHSPTCGRYAAYEKDGEVFAYGFRKKKHMRIGKGSLPEWKPGSAKLKFVRGADLWEAFPEGGNARRMTAGEEKNIVLRPYSANILEAASKDGSLAGYYRIGGKGGERPLAFGEFHASQLVQADSSDAYAYVRQHFDSPPEIVHGFLDAGEPTTVFRSNPHFKKEEWGRAERITYEGRDGKPLAGVLVYPAGYDPEKRYPMVVNIYEAQAHHLHRFAVPSLRNYSGFSVSLLANSGYFVLRPDIAYGKDSFDKSALACVAAAVERACEVATIDQERIGLMGHSFGGTQASLLASRTGIFATVIAGAGNSNLTGRYLSWSANNKRAEYWRFESGQNFMGGRTLFENMRAYIKNSSALRAESITAPMLIWTGSEDRQVPPVDSEALYLALRRLGKPGVMLKYKNEGHAIMDPQAQEDLTRKVMQWLGHYLKGEKAAEWMLPAAEGEWR